jgi:uncharacterized protein YkwD
MALVVALLLSTSVAAAPRHEPAQSLSPTDQVIALVNAERSAYGCGPLVANPQLAVAAQRHAEDMAVRNYLHHTNLDGLTFGQRITNSGYSWLQAAENIAVGTDNPQTIVQLWMYSPTHRSALLNCAMTEVAVGVAYEANDQGNVVFPDGSIGGPFYHYWVMDMAAPAR